MFDKPRATDAQLHKLEALGHFAGGIAHDFNNILSIIEGYVARAARKHDDGTLQADDLARIMQVTERGAALTRQLLAFARQGVDLDHALSVAMALNQQEVLLRPLLGENIILNLPHITGDAHVRMTPDQFTQVLLNLAINARDAMSGQGCLRIAVRDIAAADIPPHLQTRRRENAYVLLTVSDDGQGIPVDILPHIFDPFFTTKNRGVGSGAQQGGTGLGLSVVYGIIDQIGGMIDVRATPPQGTAFDLYLPLASVPELDFVNAPPPLAAGSLAGKTIVLAEDEPELRDVLTLVLSDMDMKVLPAANANEALRLQADFDGEIDFLLTDVVMPGMDGLRLSDLFAQERPQTNVVFMSGYPFSDAGGDAPMPDGADFVAKPFREDKLKSILERALARKAAREQRRPPEDSHPDDGAL